MKHYEQDVNAVILKMEVSKEDQANGFFGLKQLIERAYGKQFGYSGTSSATNKVFAIGNPYEMIWNSTLEAEFRALVDDTCIALFETDLALYVYDLFRRGHLAEAYYLIDLRYVDL